MNKAVGHILNLENAKLNMFVGGYDSFKHALNEQRSYNQALREKQLRERAHIQTFVDRFRYKATKARQAQSRLKQLARMEPISNAVEHRTIPFNFPTPTGLAPPALTMDDTAVGYHEKTVLRNLNLQIDPDDRIALLGANGNGKSTLIKLLSGQLQPIAGKITRTKNLEIGYFAQHQSEELIATETAYELLSRTMDSGSDEKTRAQLGRFGFETTHADTKIGSLSGGEKARLLFCLMSTTSPQLLLLDEPTNHLDADARDALIHALTEFPGAVVLVSHDPHTIDLVADRLWLVDKGTCRTFDGDVNDYRNFLLTKQIKQEENTHSGDKRKGRWDRREARRKRAATRNNTSALRKSAKASEDRIEALNKNKIALETKLALPETYEGATSDLLKLAEALTNIKKEIKKEESRWLAAEEELAATGIPTNNGDED